MRIAVARRALLMDDWPVLRHSLLDRVAFLTLERAVLAGQRKRGARVIERCRLGPARLGVTCAAVACAKLPGMRVVASVAGAAGSRKSEKCAPESRSSGLFPPDRSSPHVIRLMTFAARHTCVRRP